ncbi:unnamed protein product [Sphagnum jensenii]|uniref:VASt domain-containing protein n=1 Tax=Sphagnum jensenii TaxID=128206 RepID=A0ABP0X945_9BRYO
MDCNSEEGSSSSLLPGGVDRSSAASLSPENSSSSSLSSLATATRTNIFVSRVVSSPIIPLEAAAQAPPPPPPLPVVSLPPKTSDNSLVFSKQSSLPASWPKMGNDAGILEVARPNVSDDEAAPLPQQKQRSEAQSQRSQKSEEYRQLFHLPPEEMLIEDFNCALQKNILLQGHMYLFNRYVCFYSNIFGYEKKKVIPLKNVTCIRKAKTAGVFPNAIEIIAWGKKHFFASFLSRDEAFRLIVDGWIQHSSYAKLYLNSQGSLASFAVVRDTLMLSKAQGLQMLAYCLYVDRCVDEMSPNVGAPPEERGRISNLGNGEEFLENEATTSTTSISGHHHSPKWEPEEIDAPALGDGYRTLAETEFAVDVEEFYQLFFSDEAIGFVKNFHTKCGDQDFRCTQWAKHRHFGHARDISFRHPIKFYFGPKSTYCHESQRFRVYRNNHLVLETSQQMTDIPYGDYFRVEVRWDVERLFGRGRCHCFVRVSLDVSFLKKTIWRSKIEQGTFDESKGAYNTWICLVRSHHVLLSSVLEPEEENQQLRDLHAEIPGTLCNNFRHAQDNGEEINMHSRASGIMLHGLPYAQTCLQGKPKWEGKKFPVLENILLASQWLWEKGLSFDLRERGKQLKLVLFMLVAVIIVLLQVGIIITLVWAPKVQLVPVGFPDTLVRNSGTCFRGSKVDETLAWLEQRARHVKEEIALAEIQLQTLHQDLSFLQVHSAQFQKYLLELSSDSQSAHSQCL